jgi:3-deoxy-D-manno-octulosonic-acid transferase
LADFVFVGGSLIPHGGQSILEPAAAGRAIITGPHTANFKAAVDEFLGNDALVQLGSVSEAEAVTALRDIFVRLLDDKELRERLGANAARVMAENRGAAAETLRCLSTFLQVHEMRIRL